jgi:hypothetical protein
VVNLYWLCVECSFTSKKGAAGCFGGVLRGRFPVKSTEKVIKAGRAKIHIRI